jgi:hypothetical protein
MRTSKTQGRNHRSTVGKIVMALLCATMVGGTFIAPAFADDRGGGKRHQHGKYKKSKHVYRHAPRYYYSEPVYAPPPVVYAPAPYQSPGISIVFPLY